MEIPALLISMSIPPYCSNASWAICRLSASLLTSATIVDTFIPADLNSFAASISGFSRRPVINNFDPLLPKVVARALPMPELPPVITTTLSCILISMYLPNVTKYLDLTKASQLTWLI